ncbi:AAA family ATPase [Undibacterium cyanobacteriorum]|uniref:AAA family ATPase n=1 Tax=Undibacterium cyanobacteriorum TaxID=3073561 RepID=A0ABY9RKV6_9BURK|nr:AAA family ATPase [Undibacterium sp. 20NA77.5]WMW81843.1 AAA family ATPase [Undibacterium sp. 20NA77.5]
MATIHLIEGPVGAGKSTFSAALSSRTRGVHIALDEWFVRLYSPDRPEGDFLPWYITRKERLLDLIWLHSKAILAAGSDVILELGLIQQQQRLTFCRKMIGEGYFLKMYELDAPREIRRERIQHRNQHRGTTFSMFVPDHIFEIASDMWQPSDELERAEYSIEYVPSFGATVDL